MQNEPDHAVNPAEDSRGGGHVILTKPPPALMDYLFPETLILEGTSVPLGEILDGRPISHGLLQRVALSYELEAEKTMDQSMKKHLNRLKDSHNKNMTEPLQARLMVIEGELAAHVPPRDILKRAEQSEMVPSRVSSATRVRVKPLCPGDITPSPAIDPTKGFAFARSLRGIYDDPFDDLVGRTRRKRPINTAGWSEQSRRPFTSPSLPNDNASQTRVHRPSTALDQQPHVPTIPSLEPTTSTNQIQKQSPEIEMQNSDIASHGTFIDKQSARYLESDSPSPTVLEIRSQESTLSEDSRPVMTLNEEDRSIAGISEYQGKDIAPNSDDNSSQKVTSLVSSPLRQRVVGLKLHVPSDSTAIYTSGMAEDTKKVKFEPELPHLVESKTQSLNVDKLDSIPRQVRRRFAIEPAKSSNANLASYELSTSESLQPLTKIVTCPPTARGLPSSLDSAAFNRLGMSVMSLEGRIPSKGPVTGGVGGGSGHVDGPGVTLPPPLHSAVSTIELQTRVEFTSRTHEADALYPAPRLLAHPASSYALSAAPPRAGSGATSMSSNSGASHMAASATASSAAQIAERKSKSNISQNTKRRLSVEDDKSISSSGSVAAAAAAAAAALSRTSGAQSASELIADAVAEASREPGFENSGIGSGAAAVTGSISLTLRGTLPLGGGQSPWLVPPIGSQVQTSVGQRNNGTTHDKKDSDTTKFVAGMLPLLNSGAPIATSRRVMITEPTVGDIQHAPQITPEVSEQNLHIENEAPTSGNLQQDSKLSGEENANEINTRERRSSMKGMKRKYPLKQKTKSKKTVILNHTGATSQPSRMNAPLTSHQGQKREAFESRMRELQVKFHQQAAFSQSLHRIIRPLAGMTSNSDHSLSLSVLTKEPKMPSVVGGMNYIAPGTSLSTVMSAGNKTAVQDSSKNNLSQMAETPGGDAVGASEGYLERRNLRAERTESLAVPRLEQLLRPQSSVPSTFDQASLAAGGTKNTDHLARVIEATSRARAGVYAPSSAQSSLVPRCAGTPYFGEAPAQPRAAITHRTLRGKVVNISKLLLSGQSTEAQLLAQRQRRLRTADDPELGPGKHNIPPLSSRPCAVTMHVAATRVEEVAARGRVPLAAAAAIATSSTWANAPSESLGMGKSQAQQQKKKRSTVPVRIDLMQVLREDASRAKTVKIKAAHRAAALVSKLRLANEAQALENQRLGSRSLKQVRKKDGKTSSNNQTRIESQVRLAKRAMVAGHTRAQLQRRKSLTGKDEVDIEDEDDDEAILADMAGLTSKDADSSQKSNGNVSSKMQSNSENVDGLRDSVTDQDQIVAQLLADPSEVTKVNIKGENPILSHLSLGLRDPASKHVHGVVFWRAPGRGETDHDIRQRSAGGMGGKDLAVPASVVREVEAKRRAQQTANKLASTSFLQALSAADSTCDPKVPAVKQQITQYSSNTTSQDSLVSSKANTDGASIGSSVLRTESLQHPVYSFAGMSPSERDSHIREVEQAFASNRLSRAQPSKSAAVIYTSGAVASEATASSAAAAHSLVGYRKQPAHKFSTAPREVTSQDILTSGFLKSNKAASDHHALIALVPNAISSSANPEADLPEYHGRPVGWVRSKEIELGCTLPHNGRSLARPQTSIAPNRCSSPPQTSRAEGKLGVFSDAPVLNKFRPMKGDEAHLALDLRVRSILECLGVKDIHGTYITMDTDMHYVSNDEEGNRLVNLESKSEGESFVAANSERIAVGLYNPTSQALLLTARSLQRDQRLDKAAERRAVTLQQGALNATQKRKQLQQKSWLTVMKSIQTYQNLANGIDQGSIPQLGLYKRRHRAVSVIEAFYKSRNLARLIKMNAEAKTKLIRFVHICREHRRRKAAKLLVSFFVDIMNTEFEVIPAGPPAPQSNSETSLLIAQNDSQKDENSSIVPSQQVHQFPKLRKVRVLTVVNIVREYKRKVEQIQRSFRNFRSRVAQRTDLQLIWWKTVVHFARRCALGEEIWASCLTVEDDIIAEILASNPQLTSSAASAPPQKQLSVFARLSSTPQQIQNKGILSRPWDGNHNEVWPSSEVPIGQQIAKQKAKINEALKSVTSALQEEMHNYFMAVDEGNALNFPHSLTSTYESVIKRTASHATEALLKDQDALIGELGPRSTRYLSTTSLLSLRSLTNDLLASIHMACKSHARMKSLDQVLVYLQERQYEQQIQLQSQQVGSSRSQSQVVPIATLMSAARVSAEQCRIPKDISHQLAAEETENNESITVARRMLAQESCLTDDERIAYIETNYRQRRRLYMSELSRYNRDKEAFITHMKETSDFATVLKPIIDARPYGVSQSEALTKYFESQFASSRKPPKLRVFLPPFHMILLVNSCIRERLSRLSQEIGQTLSRNEDGPDIITEVLLGITSATRAAASIAIGPSSTTHQPSGSGSTDVLRRSSSITSPCTPPSTEIAKTASLKPLVLAKPPLVSKASVSAEQTPIGKAVKKSNPSLDSLMNKDTDQLVSLFHRIEGYDPTSFMYDIPKKVSISAPKAAGHRPKPLDLSSLSVDQLDSIPSPPSSLRNVSYQQQDHLLNEIRNPSGNDSKAMSRALTVQRAIKTIEALPNKTQGVSSIRVGFVELLQRLMTKDFERKAKDGLLNALSDLHSMDCTGGPNGNGLQAAILSDDDDKAKKVVQTFNKYEHKAWLKEIMKEVGVISQSQGKKSYAARRISKVLALRLKSSSAFQNQELGHEELLSPKQHTSKGPASMLRDIIAAKGASVDDLPLRTPQASAGEELRLRPRRMSVYHSAVIAPLSSEEELHSENMRSPRMQPSNLEDRYSRLPSKSFFPNQDDKAQDPSLSAENLQLEALPMPDSPPQILSPFRSSDQLIFEGLKRRGSITSASPHALFVQLPKSPQNGPSKGGNSPNTPDSLNSPSRALLSPGSGLRSLFGKDEAFSPRMQSMPDFAGVPDQPTYSLSTIQANAEKRMAAWEELQSLHTNEMNQ